MDPDQEPTPNARPFWQWLAFALAPGIVSNLVAVIARSTEDSTSGVELVAVLGIMLLLAMPLLMIPYLIIIARPYLRARGVQATSRVGFVIGFWFANAFLWGVSCGLLLNGMRFN